MIGTLLKYKLPSIFKSFKNLAVPLGLFTKSLQQQQQQYKKEEEAEHKGTLPDSIYDKLMQMADFDKPEKPKSKKQKTGRGFLRMVELIIRIMVRYIIKQDLNFLCQL